MKIYTLLKMQLKETPKNPVVYPHLLSKMAMVPLNKHTIQLPCRNPEPGGPQLKGIETRPGKQLHVFSCLIFNITFLGWQVSFWGDMVLICFDFDTPNTPNLETATWCMLGAGRK